MKRLIQFLKLILLSLVSCSLYACQSSQPTYLYLMRHPEVMQEQLSECQLNDSIPCKMVKRAAQDYLNMNNQRQENPEAFGLKILDAQIALAKKHEALQELHQEVMLRPDNQEAQKKLAAITEEYHAGLLQVDTLLAIVASTSPE